MKIILNKKKLAKIIYNERNLGFVPTMGALHKGHVSLIKKSIYQCNKTLVTIYINKPQFNKKNDYNKYPRSIKKDIALLKKLKVDILYIPTTKQIYPNGPNKKIKIHKFGKKLCGRFRSGHFEAIADVVDRFIKIIKPKKIYFGEKDFQQLKIIDFFVRKNYPRVKVVPCKTIRESNGIAFSSRNTLLNLREKAVASKIYNYIKRNKKNIINKKILINYIKSKMIKFGVNKIDYIKPLNVNKLIKPYKQKNKFKIFIAYYLKSTRLIDNI
tara:strand:+ start:198 stop:1007 length:810 start_codon:yes stop_codon:yes gene_type:complete